MFVEFSRESTVSAALIKTFNGENPCPICLSIQKGRQADKEQKTGAAHKKLEFKLGLSAGVLALLIFPVVQPFLELDTFLLTPVWESPPVPPPIYF